MSELDNYINKQLKKGVSQEDIKQALISNGYDEAAVTKFLSTYQKKTGGTEMAQNMNYAGFWIRLVAAILDTFIIGIPMSILQVALVLATGQQSMQYIVSLLAAAFVIYMTGTKGGTPGKLIIGLRIVNEKGKFIGIPGALLRYIGTIISTLLLGIGYLMIAFDSKKQGLHDKIAGTYVVRK